MLSGLFAWTRPWYCRIWGVFLGKFVSLKNILSLFMNEGRNVRVIFLICQNVFSLGFWSWISLLLWMWVLNVWDNVPMDLKYVCQQYLTCMCFLGFIRYNKTFIACGFMNYENVSTHEYHIPLGCCPQRIWYSWVNTFSYFTDQHAIKV